MATFLRKDTLPTPSNQRDTDARRMGDLLDILIALRMDVGHSANGIAASPTLGPKQMREVRVLLDCAMTSAKEILDSIPYSLASVGWPRFPAQSESQIDTYDRIPSTLTDYSLHYSIAPLHLWPQRTLTRTLTIES
jgi:hypothetical protein